MEIMTDRERTIIPQIIEEATKLPDEDKLKLLWIAKGILIANKHERKS